MPAPVTAAEADRRAAALTAALDRVSAADRGPVVEALVDALLVVVLDRAHRAWMVEHDPQALGQAFAALEGLAP